jgi:RimJ/RimL family protein N-acetyltransferase
LEVRKSNVAAIKLYEKFGFEVDGERKKYYRDNGEAALLMSCFLKSKIYYEEIFAKVADPISKQGKEVLS